MGEKVTGADAGLDDKSRRLQPREDGGRALEEDEARARGVVNVPIVITSQGDEVGRAHEGAESDAPAIEVVRPSTSTW